MSESGEASNRCPCRCHAYGAGTYATCDAGPEIPGGRSCSTLDHDGTPDVPAEPEREPATARDLWNAADRLTKPRRTRLIRDDGRTSFGESVELPSLLDQLTEAMESGQESGAARGVPASRPPTDIAAMSLLIEIAGTVRDACRQRSIRRTFDTAGDLRSLVSAVNTEGHGERIDKCHRLVISWCGRIKATISSDVDRSWRLHGAACRVCQATTVPTASDDGTETRQPALIVQSEDGVIQSVTCDFCGSRLAGPDMLEIVREIRRNIDRPKAVAGLCYLTNPYDS